MTIDELLNELMYGQAKKNEGILPNTIETWSSIGKGESLKSYVPEGTDEKAFLKEWIDENPYSAI